MKKQLKILSVFLLVATLASTSFFIVSANKSVNPVAKSEGDKVVTVLYPKENGRGDGAEVLTPIEKSDSDNAETFVADIKDYDTFIDMEAKRDFSTQYDYSEYVLYNTFGNCTLSDGTYTAVTDGAIYADLHKETAFPYGTLSADVMNNGGDTGLIIGLSANTQYFWEGEGIEYYFIFINFEGVLMVGRTVDGGWDMLCYTSVPGYSATAVYNLKVVYWVDKMLVVLDDATYLTYRTSRPLQGTCWGIRTGAVGATIGNIEISNKVIVD